MRRPLHWIATWIAHVSCLPSRCDAGSSVSFIIELVSCVFNRTRQSSERLVSHTRRFADHLSATQGSGSFNARAPLPCLLMLNEDVGTASVHSGRMRDDSLSQATSRMHINCLPCQTPYWWLVISVLRRFSRTGNSSEEKCEVGCDRIVRSVREQVDGGTVVHKQGWDSRMFPAHRLRAALIGWQARLSHSSTRSCLGFSCTLNPVSIISVNHEIRSFVLIVETPQSTVLSWSQRSTQRRASSVLHCPL